MVQRILERVHKTCELLVHPSLSVGYHCMESDIDIPNLD